MQTFPIYFQATKDPVPSKPRSKLMIAIDVVKRFMLQFHYGLFDGSIYKKAPEAKFTFVFCSSVSDFIHSILGNAEIADMIAAHVTQIVNLLSVNACRLIKPITIDFNFIEVLPAGTCFNIEEKKFEIDPKNLKGIIVCYCNFLFGVILGSWGKKIIFFFFHQGPQEPS